MGLDAAGKTTILYKLKLGEIVTTIPTIGKRTSKIPSLVYYLKPLLLAFIDLWQTSFGSRLKENTWYQTTLPHLHDVEVLFSDEIISQLPFIILPLNYV